MEEDLNNVLAEERAWDKYLDRLEQQAEMANERAKDFINNVIGPGSDLEQLLRKKIQRFNEPVGEVK